MYVCVYHFRVCFEVFVSHHNVLLVTSNTLYDVPPMCCKYPLKNSKQNVLNFRLVCFELHRNYKLVPTYQLPFTEHFQNNLRDKNIHNKEIEHQ